MRGRGSRSGGEGTGAPCLWQMSLSGTLSRERPTLTDPGSKHPIHSTPKCSWESLGIYPKDPTRQLFSIHDSHLFQFKKEKVNSSSDHLSPGFLPSAAP